MTRIDVFELKTAYKSISEKEQYLLDLLQQLRNAILEFSDLESFSGVNAVNVKSYMAEVHTRIIDSLSMGLAELEVKLMNYHSSFASVDATGYALLDESRLSLEEELTGRNITSGNFHQINTDKILTSVSDIVTLSKPDYDTFLGVLTDAKSFLSTTKTNLTNFDKGHANDMDNINELLSSISLACQYTTATVEPAYYTPQSFEKEEYIKKLDEDILDAFEYMSGNDEDYTKTKHYQLAARMGLEPSAEDVDVTSPGRNLDKVNFVYTLYNSGSALSDLWNGVSDWRKFKMLEDANMSILTHTNAAGKPVYTLQSITGSRLRPWGLGVLDTGNLSNGQMIQAFDLLESQGGLTQANAGKRWVDLLDGVAVTRGETPFYTFTGELRRGMKDTVTDKGTWVSAGITLALDVHDACYDERTDSFKTFNGREFAADVIVDGGAIVAPVAVKAIVATAIPGVGPVAVAGYELIDIVLSFIEYGDVPKTLNEHLKDDVEYGLEAIDVWYKRCFW